MILAMAQLPFFYGWVVVAVAFVTMAIGVNARTAFSLFFPTCRTAWVATGAGRSAVPGSPFAIFSCS